MYTCKTGITSFPYGLILHVSWSSPGYIAITRAALVLFYSPFFSVNGCLRVTVGSQVLCSVPMSNLSI
jgi:hypothetical protein